MNQFKNGRLQIAVIALAAGIGSEIKIYPFTGDSFRIGLGVSVFLLFLLFMRQLNYWWTGIATGLVSILFQGVEWMIRTGSWSVTDALQHNIPAGIYYVVYAYGMMHILRRTEKVHPLLLGGFITIVDFVSNEAELLLRGLFIGAEAFYLEEWFNLLAIAFVRSYFVIGLYSSISFSQIRALHAEQEKRMEQMLHIGSGLYGETFYLKKSMEEIEQITASSFQLYRGLKEADEVGFSRQALGIAQQIHEVKKDSQRILAGLTKLYDSEIAVDMSIQELLSHVAKANQKYGEMLGKTIDIHQQLNVRLVTPYYVPLLTVLNNLTANAVEAIGRSGSVTIHAYESGKMIVFSVVDTGQGIPEADWDIIFEPGYTTKFDEAGMAATGIGLSHVRDIILSFGGRIHVEGGQGGMGSNFILQVPKDALV
ncbi:two-component system sensor histidine kinase YcbA [Paenibacillus phyllosphaerae]|uniref:histidine kinase n=1 Tax=Paenibacillus phyllosphaerae TaxID=274593 RepID=A0A7W5AXG2_9BACL|nr:two-component system sensor histidine kinase YcbA [Paenibacillus phyllosphaerae]